MAVLDAAAIVAKAIMEITAASSVPKTDQETHIANLLRDEFAAVRREARDDHTPDDDDAGSDQ